MKCCLCNKNITGVGNNPTGALYLDLTEIKWNKDQRCCDDCYMEIVVPNIILKRYKKGTL